MFTVTLEGMLIYLVLSQVPDLFIYYYRFETPARKNASCCYKGQISKCPGVSGVQISNSV